MLAFLFFRHFDLDGELGGPMYQLKFDIAEREREREREIKYESLNSNRNIL